MGKFKEGKEAREIGLCVDIPRDNADIFDTAYKATLDLLPRWNSTDTALFMGLPKTKVHGVDLHVRTCLSRGGIIYAFYEIDSLTIDFINIDMIGSQQMQYQAEQAMRNGQLRINDQRSIR